MCHHMRQQRLSCHNLQKVLMDQTGALPVAGLRVAVNMTALPVSIIGT